MKIVIYGLTITSSWGNGHATTYRSLLKSLAQLGHTIHFIEKDVEWYRNNRDLPKPDFCTVQLYEDWGQDEANLLTSSKDADVIVVGSYFPDAIRGSETLLEKLDCPIFFYDIDTPITLNHLRSKGQTEYLDASLIPQYAAYLSFTGGTALTELEGKFGAKKALPLFCSVDAELYRPTAVKEEYRCDLSYLGTYAADRQSKLKALLNDTAELLPNSKFVVAGPQYPASLSWSPNVARFDHVAPPDHPSFYSSSRFTLNLTREEMVAIGYSPSVRLFEASACGAAIVSDCWEGLSDFLTPGKEILLPKSATEAADILLSCSDGERKMIGENARARILAEHTSEHRAREFEQVVESYGW